jgi:glycosyltransferase involved in cell wall biosynthesis
VRICFLSRRYFPTISGMSVYADNMVRQLVALGHDVTMLSQYYGGATAGVYGGGPPPDIDGATVAGFESIGEQESGDFERDIDELANEVKHRHAAEPFDVVHAQYGYPTGYAALRAARELGLPCVISIQGGDGHWVGDCCGTHRRAMQTVCRDADAVIIGSDSFAGEVTERLDVPRDVFTIIPGAVDTSRFHPSSDRRLGDLNEPPRLLYHGRVDARKGVLELLDAVTLLRGAGRDFSLQISGIGPDYEETKRRAEGMAGVSVTGHADYFAAPNIYRSADVFVSPTHAEGFSNTILEAMASGLPIVSCEAVGVVDCLQHERDALLVPVSDVRALAAAIARLLDGAPLRRRLAGNALAEVRALYAWPAIAQQIAAVYKDVAAGPPRQDFEPVAGPPDACRFRSEPHLL